MAGLVALECSLERSQILYILELLSSFAGDSPTSRPSGVRSRGGARIEFFFWRQRRNVTSKLITTRKIMPRAMLILAPVERSAPAPKLFDIVVEVELDIVVKIRLDNPMLLVEFEKSTALLRVGSGTLPLSSKPLEVNAGQAGVVAVAVAV